MSAQSWLILIWLVALSLFVLHIYSVLLVAKKCLSMQTKINAVLITRTDERRQESA